MRIHLPRRLAIIVATALFVVLPNTTRAQSGDTCRPLTGNLVSDVACLLRPGTYRVDILDTILISPRRTELTLKFVGGIRKNPDAYMKQQKDLATTGGKAQYDPRFGLTESEWTEYQNMMENQTDLEMVSTGKESLTIMRAGDTIRFASQGKLAIFNQVTIDLAHATAVVAGHVIALHEPVSITRADNPLKSPWKGYSWQFTTKEAGKIHSISDPRSVTIETYSLTIGLLDPTGKTYLEAKAQKIDHGTPIMSFRTPITF